MGDATRSPRVLVIASFPESLVGVRGALLQALVRAGHVVHVAAPGLPSGSPTRLMLEQWGIAVHEIPMRRAGMNPFEDVVTLRSLCELCGAVEPTHVLAYTVKPVVYGLWAARIARVPNRFALITGLGYAFGDRPKGLRGILGLGVRLLYLNALRGSACVFFQNPDDEATFLRLGLVRSDTPTTVVNGSGVNLSEFALAPVPQTAHFLLIARLLREKGVYEYAEAARRIKLIHPDARFSLVGWMDDTPDAIDQLDLDGWIRDGILDFLGKLDDVRPVMASCSVYVLPSYREGTPRSVLEAMAMGRAVITTDAPGCRDTVIDGESGYLVPVRSVESLVRAMERFIVNPELATVMGRRSRQIAVEKYDVHKVNAAMLRGMGL